MKMLVTIWTRLGGSDFYSPRSQVLFGFTDPSHIYLNYCKRLMGILKILFLFLGCVLMRISICMCVFSSGSDLVLHLNLDLWVETIKSLWVWFGLAFGFGYLLNQIWHKFDLCEVWVSILVQELEFFCCI